MSRGTRSYNQYRCTEKLNWDAELATVGRRSSFTRVWSAYFKVAVKLGRKLGFTFAAISKLHGVSVFKVRRYAHGLCGRALFLLITEGFLYLQLRVGFKLAH